MTEFEIFQAVRDAYLSRYVETERTDVFAWARARVVASELGLSEDAAHTLVRQIRLSYGPMRFR